MKSAICSTRLYNTAEQEGLELSRFKRTQPLIQRLKHMRDLLARGVASPDNVVRAFFTLSSAAAAAGQVAITPDFTLPASLTRDVSCGAWH